jgi:uncharacterized protein DUF4157
VEKATGTRETKTENSAPPSHRPAGPSYPTSNPVLRLQRIVGNQAVLRMFNLTPPLPTPPLPAVSLLQRKCACGGSESPCASCQEEREEGMVQRKASGTSDESGVPAIVHEVLRSPGDALDRETRAFFEPGFNADFSDVRVHTDAKAAESARAVNARAYAVGRDVVFDTGQYAPQTQAGRRLLAHELVHTVQSPAAISPSLDIGRVDDPAEYAADLAADAVMSGERLSLSSAGGATLRRQHRTCRASQSDRPDRRIVRCDDGNEYRVTLTTSPGPREPDTRTSVNAGWNDTEIYLNIDVCRGGTAVQITPSVDLPRAVGQALGNVLAGSGALSGVTLAPGLQVTVHQSDSFTLTLGPTVTVGQHGVTGGGLTATVETPDLRASGSVTYDAPTRAAFLTFTFSAGSPQRRVDCTRKGKPRLVFECERVTHVARVPDVPEKAVTDTQARYVFFDYAKPNIRLGFRLPTDIQSLYDQGFRVTSIEGFTSPEGPREKGPGFEGNIRLGQERADAALTWLHDKACPNCDLSGVTPQGRGELPPKVGSQLPETKGPGMERSAVEEFWSGARPDEKPDPLAPQSEAERAAFRRLPPSQQRETAFQLMRRAEITLQRRRVTQEHKAEVPAREEYNRVDCERGVIDAARASFGISIATGAIIRR